MYNFKIIYGTKETNIDVTNKCYNSLCNNGIIKIQFGDEERDFVQSLIVKPRKTGKNPKHPLSINSGKRKLAKKMDELVDRI